MASNKLNPSAAAQKWKSRVQASGDSYKSGVQGVTDNPAQKAIAQADVWLQNVAQAKDKFVNSLSGVTLDFWKSQTGNGASRYVAGADKGVSKQQNVYNQLFPYIANAKSTLPSRGNFEQNKARMLAMVDSLKNFKYKRS